MKGSLVSPHAAVYAQHSSSASSHRFHSQPRVHSRLLDQNVTSPVSCHLTMIVNASVRSQPRYCGYYSSEYVKPNGSGNAGVYGSLVDPGCSMRILGGGVAWYFPPGFLWDKRAGMVFPGPPLRRVTESSSERTQAGVLVLSFAYALIHRNSIGNGGAPSPGVVL